MLTCPNCHGKNIGKIGTNQYYCWNCFVEFVATGEKVSSVFQVEEDGTLHSLNDLFLMIAHRPLKPICKEMGIKWHVHYGLEEQL